MATARDEAGVEVARVRVRSDERRAEEERRSEVVVFEDMRGRQVR